MYKVFLSPAQHHKTCLVKGCSEAIHCNLIVDAMEPWLDAAGIEWLRNDKTTERPIDHVNKANAWGADLYIAIHTNAGGGKRCTIYNSGSEKSIAVSEVMAKAFGEVYLHLIKPSEKYPAKTLREYWTELTDSDAPAIYSETWFHDNQEDANWGHEHIEETARAFVNGICDWFGIERPKGKNEEKPEVKPEEENKVFYVVHAGAFSNRDSAQAAVNLVKEVYPKAYVASFNGVFYARCELNENRNYALANAEKLEDLVPNPGIYVK